MLLAKGTLILILHTEQGFVVASDSLESYRAEYKTAKQKIFQVDKQIAVCLADLGTWGNERGELLDLRDSIRGAICDLNRMPSLSFADKCMHVSTGLELALNEIQRRGANFTQLGSEIISTLLFCGYDGSAPTLYAVSFRWLSGMVIPVSGDRVFVAPELVPFGPRTCIDDLLFAPKPSTKTNLTLGALLKVRADLGKGEIRDIVPLGSLTLVEAEELAELLVSESVHSLSELGGPVQMAAIPQDGVFVWRFNPPTTKVRK